MTEIENKFVAIALLMALWGLLVWNGLAPVADYVAAIKWLLALVSGLHIVKNYGASGQ